MKEKKPVPKFLKIILIVLLVVLVLVILVAIFAPDPEEPEVSAPEATTQAIPQRTEAVGKSDLSSADLLGSSKPYSMNNDATGQWKLVSFASPAGEIERYALDYYLQNFTKEAPEEVHWLVNFTTGTTTSIKCLSGVLFVDSFEYVENEEHDAKAIGGGLPLSSYLVYLDNGDIVKA